MCIGSAFSDECCRVGFESLPDRLKTSPNGRKGLFSCPALRDPLFLSAGVIRVKAASIN